MGEKTGIRRGDDSEQLRVFMKILLKDVRALEQMLADGMIESGIRRIGAEQELVLVDPSWRPAPYSAELIEELDDPKFTTELGKFNLEFNLPPLLFGKDCLRKMHGRIDTMLTRLRSIAEPHGVKVLLTGILPTLNKSDLGLHNMTDLDRYRALNDAMNRLRGGPYELRIMGTDELNIQHSTVMLESCNTSFQVHFQTGPEEFAKLYNIAQAISGPLLSAATNSPVLFQKRLWRETRIALFSQSLDTRQASKHLRELSPRVSFGNRWVDESVLEVFKEDIARFRVLIGTVDYADPFDAIAAGQPPKLKALQLHNSTIYRWNRPCYGVLEGKPHLRIENRYLPAGPTPVDEVANAALWFGLMCSLSEEYDDIRRHIEFDDVKGNFLAAARHGLEAHFNWLGGRMLTAKDLLCDELLPRARQGLANAGVDASDVDCYLGVIDDRVRSGQTGSLWMLRSLAEMKNDGNREERYCALTAQMSRLEQQGLPVHEWPLAQIENHRKVKVRFMSVEQIMTTDLFTVNQDELIDLVANVMDWQHIRHVPVEDNQHRLVGLVTHRSLLRVLGRGMLEGKNRTLPVSAIMQRDLITVSPNTSTREAIGIMRRERIACLPVVEDGQLVGIVTERDFMELAAQLVEKNLED